MTPLTGDIQSSLMHRDRRVVTQGRWRGMGSYELMGTDSQFCKMESGLWGDGGEGRITVRTQLMASNCTLQNG